MEQRAIKEEMPWKELLGGTVDLEGVKALITDLRKEIIDMMYDEELKNHLGFSKHDTRLENSDNYCNSSYEKSVKMSSGSLIYQFLEIEMESLSCRL